MYINKAIIYGNLTRDPENKSLPSGIEVSNLSVATNRVWKDRDGRKQESVEYHNVVLFGRLAELASQYLKKGNGVYLEGRLQTRSWDDQQSGGKKYRTEIVADVMQFGPKGGGNSSSSYDSSSKGRSKSDDNQSVNQSVPEIEYPSEEVNPDDIPF